MRSLLSLFSALILLVALTGCAKTNDASQPEHVRICFNSPGDPCIDAEVMRTPEERELGLMDRESLACGKGMLFVFEEPGDYGFWMKGMKIQIDMIWTDGNGTLVHIEKQVKPCDSSFCPSYSPGSPARYVIEACSGFSEANSLAAGSKAKINFKTG